LAQAVSAFISRLTETKLRSCGPLSMALAKVLVLAQSVGSVSAVTFRNPILDTPDLTAYDPTEVLCAKGKTADGKANVQGWCRDWVSCIKTNAQPAGDAAAVRAAWKPADCREFCGVWPVTSKPEGSTFLAVSKLFGTKQNNTKDCMSSCANFQESLTNCVAKILFEPGKVAAMGIPDKSQPTGPALCSIKNTHCLPDLKINYQKCLSKASSPSKDCANLKASVDECKDCPQLQENYLSHYHAFTGGCMDQLNAYWQATHPSAKEAAVPGAAGCAVH